MPVASAQVKSGMLLKGLYAEGETSVMNRHPPVITVSGCCAVLDMTCRLEGSRASLIGGGRLTATRIDVPSDISSAAFPAIRHLDYAWIGSDAAPCRYQSNPHRCDRCPCMMGGNIELLHLPRSGSLWPISGFAIPRSKAFRFPGTGAAGHRQIPCIVYRRGVCRRRTLLTGAEELRVKGDRIQVMADGLKQLGGNRSAENGIRIQGSDMQGGRVDSHGDHHVAIAFSIAALRAKAISRYGLRQRATSFPGFVELANGSGFSIETLTEGER